MSLKKIIAEDFKNAFKNKETDKKETLSMIQSDIKNKEIELKKREKGLNDEEVIEVLRRAIKQRKDAQQQYKDGGRDELAEKEKKEADVLMNYLPKQMGDEEIEARLVLIIEQVGANGEKDLGKVMGTAMALLKDKADGSKVRKIARQLLQKQGDEHD
ncbi:MAG: GatB/YqeY domain-containing protein [Patescibacteria group bacterium]|nr:GatB/YqeY domain-containing protein [Patescibacteria group bacterium]